MKRKLKNALIVSWAIALALPGYARAADDSTGECGTSPTCAMREWRVAVANMGDLRTPLDPSQLVHGAGAISRAKSIGGTTERECELIDAVAQFYHRHEERTHDMRLVHYERALSRSLRHLPDDVEIAALHAHASRVAHARAVERVEAAWAARVAR